MTEFGLTDEGLDLPREADLRERFKKLYEEFSEESPSWERDTFLGAIALTDSRIKGEITGSLQDLWDGLHRERASGAMLDAHLALAGISRKRATYSSVTLELSGDNGTVIPALSQVEDEDGVIWETQEDITIPQTGVAEVVARPIERGPIAAAEDEITTISTPISGWESVTNPSPATRGQARQTDAEARLAIRERLRSGVGSSFRGIQAEVANLSFIETAVVVHNPTNNEETVDGMTLPPHSFQVVVYPDDLTSEEEDTVFETIFDVSPIGIQSVGDEFKTIENWPVRFSYAEEVQVSYNLVLSVEPGYVISVVQAEIRSRIDEYINNLGVGQDVRETALVGVASQVTGVVYAAITEINGNTNVPKDLTVNANQVPVAAVASP